MNIYDVKLCKKQNVFVTFYDFIYKQYWPSDTDVLRLYPLGLSFVSFFPL